MKMITRMLKVAMVLVLAAGVACAETIQYSATVNNGGANYQAGTGGNFVLPQFNPALGTLESVVVEVTGFSIGGVNQIDNESATDSGSATLTLGSSVTIVSGADTMTVVVLPSESVTGSVTTDTDVAPNFVGTDTLGISGTTSQDTDSNSPVALAPYIGTGNITFSFASTGNTSIGLNAPLDFVDFFGPNGFGINSVNPYYYLNASITYQYTASNTPMAAPEPGTLVIGSLLACTAVPFARKRRRGTRAESRPSV